MTFPIADQEGWDVGARLDVVTLVDHAFLGKKGGLSAVNQRLGSLAPDERREAGRLVNETRSRVTAACRASSSRRPIPDSAS